MKMYQCVFKIFKVHETPCTEEQERNHLSNGDFHKQFRTGNHGSAVRTSSEKALGTGNRTFLYEMASGIHRTEYTPGA